MILTQTDAENVDPNKEAERWIQHNFVDHHVKQFEGIPGPRKVLDRSKAAQDFFHLMWPKALYQYIADETNKYVKFNDTRHYCLKRTGTMLQLTKSKCIWVCVST